IHIDEVCGVCQSGNWRYLMSTSQIDLTSPAHLTQLNPDSAAAMFLMCPPRLYDVNYIINPWMAANVHASSRPRAAEQWQNLYNAVGKVAEIELIDPEPGSPDMVFTANAGLEHNGTVAISSFFHPERQGEEPHFRRWFQEAGYTLLDNPPPPPPLGGGGGPLSTPPPPPPGGVV